MSLLDDVQTLSDDAITMSDGYGGAKTQYYHNLEKLCVILDPFMIEQSIHNIVVNVSLCQNDIDGSFINGIIILQDIIDFSVKGINVAFEKKTFDSIS